MGAGGGGATLDTSNLFYFPTQLVALVTSALRPTANGGSNFTTRKLRSVAVGGLFRHGVDRPQEGKRFRLSEWRNSFPIL